MGAYKSIAKPGQQTNFGLNAPQLRQRKKIQTLLRSRQINWLHNVEA
jgi:hypothetical protein